MNPPEAREERAGPGSGPRPGAIALQMVGVRKAFGAVTALDGASLALRDGEIHGLLGGNGAGKTTLMNILYGLYRADAGQILLQGAPVEIRAPRDAIRLGIGMVHQHFLQIGSFTVTQNIVLATRLKRRFALSLGDEEARIADLAGRFGLAVAPRAFVETLPIGTRQRVEILKALYRGVRILILDEPTTNLTPQEVESLFDSLRAMAGEGMSVVFITHKIREALTACDRISVMRDGRDVLTLPRAEATDEVLVHAMVGETVDVRRSLLFSQAGAARESVSSGGGAPTLRVDGLRGGGEGGAPAVDECSLEVGPGEILGIAGVAGNGQRELVEGLLGLRAIAGGTISIGGVDLAGKGPADLLAMGVTYIPEDRLHDGFLPTSTVAENLVLGFHRLPAYNRRGVFNWKEVFQIARRLIAEYSIRTPGPEQAAANLSGGNIQRLMLARAFSHLSLIRVLVAHNPTRGLDIPSTEFVYEKLLDLRRQGVAVLLISEDLEELLLLCDRIAVLYRGRIVGLHGRPALDRYELGRLMSGITVEQPAERGAPA